MIYIRYIDLPFSCGGFTIPDADGNYNIYLNSHHCYERQRTTLRREMNHIECKDFDKPLPAHIIELLQDKRNI